MNCATPRFALLLAPLAFVAACKKPAADGTPDAAASAMTAAVTASAKAPEESFEEKLKKSKPLSITTNEQTTPGGKVTAEVCELEGGPLTNKSNMDLFKSIRAIGDRVFVLTGYDDTVHAYKVAPGPKCKLTIDSSFGTNGVTKVDKGSVMVNDPSGNLWVSTGVFGAKRLGKDGKENGKCEARPLGYMYLSEDGKLGIGTFANSTVAKVTIKPDGSCASEPWAFTDLGQADKRKGVLTNAQAVGFVGGTIFMGGVIAKEVDPSSPNTVLALDAAGKEKFRMGRTDKDFSKEDRFGWVHAIAGCKAGVCVLDSNFRRITMWKSTGAYVGAVNLSKLLGLAYPWISDFAVGKAVTYLVAGQDRDVKGVGEGNIYRVTGL